MKIVNALNKRNEHEHINSGSRALVCVIGYEVSMLRALIATRINVSSKEPQRTKWLLANCITEGKVLHTRNLCDFCTSTRKNDIKPLDLFDNYEEDPDYEKLRRLIKSLGQEYDKLYEGKSARWVFNKMLAHPTKERGTGFDYGPYLELIWPVLHKIIDELDTFRGRPLLKSGSPFYRG